MKKIKDNSKLVCPFCKQSIKKLPKGLSIKRIIKTCARICGGIEENFKKLNEK